MDKRTISTDSSGITYVPYTYSEHGRTKRGYVANLAPADSTGFDTTRELARKSLLAKLATADAHQGTRRYIVGTRATFALYWDATGWAYDIANGEHVTGCHFNSGIGLEEAYQSMARHCEQYHETNAHETA